MDAGEDATLLLPPLCYLKSFVTMWLNTQPTIPPQKHWNKDFFLQLIYWKKPTLFKLYIPLLKPVKNSNV